MSRAWLRWMPAAAVPAVIAVGVLAGSIPARAGDPLPEKTPAQVLVLLGGHTVTTLSGTVAQSSELGLPELPQTGPSSGPASAGGAASIAELLTGQHTARVYVDGPSKVRIQVVDRLAERDVIRRDGEIWFYSSRDNSAAHLTLPSFARDLPLTEPPTGPTPPDQVPAPTPGLPKPELPAPGLPLPPIPAPDMPIPVPMPEYSLPTPEDIATRLLAAVDSSTQVTVGPDVEVAGRAAYNLLLEPRTQGTLVGRVAIAVDGETGLPLRATVTARDQAEPAFQVGFTSLSLAKPDDSLFTFAPPPGATIKELQLPLPGAGPWPVMSGYPEPPGTIITPDTAAAENSSGTGRSQMPAMARPTVTGTGWETVIGFPAAHDGQGSMMTESLLKDPFLAQAAVVVPGGRLLSTTLVNVLITDDGRIFVGMVPAERLQAAAGSVAK